MSPGRMANAAAILAVVLAGHAAPAAAQAVAPEALVNRFGDPFVQATSALPGCPEPLGPRITLAQMREQAHGRVERGTTCYRAGRCRLPNAYLYDADIIARTTTFIRQDARFADTSVWLVGQRRWVMLQGCVRTAGQAEALEREVRGIDDVEAVVNELMVGTTGHPRYALP